MLSIRRKGGAWYYCRGTVKVGTKKQVVAEHATGCREREAAENYRTNLEREIQQELLHGTAGRARNLTVADALLDYVSRPAGLHKMDVWRVGELNEALGGHTISDVKTAWSAFVKSRCDGLAPATVNRFRDTLQAALNHAIPDGAPKIDKIKFSNERVRWLSRTDRDKLIGSYADHVQPIIKTLCYQGCRTQEALQLPWEHVDLASRRMYFARTKSGEPRTVKMHAVVDGEVRRLWLERDKPTNGHVFLNRLGEPYSDTRNYKYPGGNPLRKAHATALDRTGINDFRVHDWRHHWASWCVMSGIDLLTVQKMGGWKSLDMVKRYAALSTEHMDEAVDKIA